jgi:hypothetical protein
MSLIAIKYLNHRYFIVYLINYINYYNLIVKHYFANLKMNYLSDYLYLSSTFE